MPLHLSFQLNDTKVRCRDGASILEAALESGDDIPQLCSSASGGGACRLCTVHVDGRHVAACSTEARQGMSVQSRSDQLDAHRRLLVALMLMETQSAEQTAETRLSGLAEQFGIGDMKNPALNPERETAPAHPEICVDTSRCVLCGACVREIRSTTGQPVFRRFGRGFDTYVAADPDAMIPDVDKAVAICPTGAITRN